MLQVAFMVVLVSVSVSLAGAEANVTSCVTHTDFLGIEKVNFKPDPVKIGKVLRVKV